MSNGHAPKGGIMGINGEFYEGGKFLPSTDRPKGEPKPAKKFTGPRKEQISRYEWAERPEGMRSIYAAIVGTQAAEQNGIVTRCEAGCTYYGENVKLLGVELGTVNELIERFNRGDRWVAA